MLKKLLLSPFRFAKKISAYIRSESNENVERQDGHDDNTKETDHFSTTFTVVYRINYISTDYHLYPTIEHFNYWSQTIGTSSADSGEQPSRL